MSGLWLPVLATCAGCYALKALGLHIPERWLAHRRTGTALMVLPVALLASLATSQTAATGQHLVIDARLAGVAAGSIAAMARAPFVVVIAVAAGTAAALRLAGLS